MARFLGSGGRGNQWCFGVTRERLGKSFEPMSAAEAKAALGLAMRGFSQQAALGLERLADAGLRKGGREAAHALLRPFLNSRGGRAFLSVALSDRDTGTRLAGAYLHGILPPSGAPRMLNEAVGRERNPDVAGHLAWALTRIQHPSSEGALLKLSSHTDAYTRTLALQGLAFLDTPAARRRISSLEVGGRKISEHTVSSLAGRLRSGSEEERVRAVLGISHHLPSDRGVAVNSLLGVVKEKYEEKLRTGREPTGAAWRFAAFLLGKHHAQRSLEPFVAGRNRELFRETVSGNPEMRFHSGRAREH